MDWHQPDRPAIAPLQQRIESSAPFVIDAGNRDHVVAHQAKHSGPQMRQEASHCVDDDLHLQNFYMLTTVLESSMSLVGLPSRSWTHLWTEWLRFPEWRGEDLAGLLVMPTRPLLVEPTEELWSCLSNSRSSGTMLWQPTTGLVRVVTFHDVPALPWTPPCPATCVDLLLWWWGCSSSADWTLRCIFGRGATVNCPVLKCIPRNWNSWLGVRSDFSKLITHPSLGCNAMVISECIWACSGDSAQINQLSM